MSIKNTDRTSKKMLKDSLIQGYEGADVKSLTLLNLIYIVVGIFIFNVVPFQKFL